MTPLDKLPQPLLQWYDTHHRALPWRQEVSPYRTWVSEIMLQQTRVSTVIPYFEHFMAVFPTIETLANAPEETLLRLWQGLGYYSRARNLQKAAQLLRERGEAALPADYDALRALPGIGDYTAGAILSIAYGQKICAVDGNVLRIVSRLTGFDGNVLDGKNRALLRSWVEEILPEKRAGDFNQALMDLGATVCLPNGSPLCEACPSMEFCVSRRENKAAELPFRGKKNGKKEEQYTVFFLRRENTVALRQREDTGLLAKLWEFPMAVGHLSEEEAAAWLGQHHVTPHRWQKKLSAKHEFTHIRWHMIGYVAEVSGTGDDDWVWCDSAAADTHPIPSAFEKFKKEFPDHGTVIL